MLNGAPATQVGPLVRVPGNDPIELVIVVPLPSFMPQRATGPRRK